MTKIMNSSNFHDTEQKEYANERRPARSGSFQNDYSIRNTIVVLKVFYTYLRVLEMIYTTYTQDAVVLDEGHILA